MLANLLAGCLLFLACDTLRDLIVFVSPRLVGFLFAAADRRTASASSAE